MHPFDRAVAEANERIRTCHERVPCPKCGAGILRGLEHLGLATGRGGWWRAL